MASASQECFFCWQVEALPLRRPGCSGNSRASAPCPRGRGDSRAGRRVSLSSGSLTVLHTHFHMLDLPPCTSALLNLSLAPCFGSLFSSVVLFIPFLFLPASYIIEFILLNNIFKTFLNIVIVISDLIFKTKCIHF